MALAKIEGVRLSGIASAVPDTLRPVTDFNETFGVEDVQRISQSTGVEQRGIAAPKLCCSDLCYAAAKRLLKELDWDPETVDGLIFVSQSPDFDFVPATSCVLQMRLGLPKSCAAFDITLGCSGYVYGLWIAAGMIANGGLRRALLLVGDINRGVSPSDRSTALLFGDAGTATAIEKDATGSPLVFQLGTDGTGWEHLIIPAGGKSSRRPRDASTCVRRQAEANNFRSPEDLTMNGAEIFAFTIREVPPLVNGVLAASGWNKEEVDHFILHQANKFIIKHLAKSMKLPLQKVPFSLVEYGNTSSASIPLTVNSKLGDVIRSQPLKLLMAGFGVGFSWGACTATCGPMVAPSVILVNESEAWQCC